jgi:hypothetical protein
MRCEWLWRLSVKMPWVIRAIYHSIKYVVMYAKNGPCRLCEAGREYAGHKGAHLSEGGMP